MKKLRSFAAATAAAVLMVGPQLAAQGEPGPQTVEGCEIVATFYNKDRRVPGPVNQECGLTIHNYWAPDGFGNWGVDSSYGTRHDTYQFAGWKEVGGKYQWQSCTGEHVPPDPDKYNDLGYTSQKAAPDDVRAYASTSWFIEDRACIDLTAANTFNTIYMDLWELDRPDPDDYVGSLRYPGRTLVLDCDDDWNCSADTNWIAPVRSTGNVSAKVRIRVVTRHAIVESWDFPEGP